MYCHNVGHWYRLSMWRFDEPMTTITVQIDDQKAACLHEKAAHLGLNPGQLVSASIDDLLSCPEPEFDAAARRVLSKNRELYQRLA